MSRDSGGDQPTQRTVAELLAEYGKSGSQSSSRRRRRRAEDPSETAPQAIIDRVLSDSGKMRPVDPDAEPPATRRQGQLNTGPAQPQQAQQPAQPQPQPQQPPAPARPPAPATPPAQAPGPAAPPVAEPQAPDPSGSSGTGYWAQRLTSGNQAAAPPSQPSTDAEATVQHPPVRPAPPSRPVTPAQPPETATQKLPRPEPPAYPQRPAPESDPYDFDDSLAKSYPSQGYDSGFSPIEDYSQDYGRDSGDEYADEYFDSSAPAGLDGVADEEPDRPASPGREWGTVALQGIIGLIGGGAVWIGFRWLWIHATIAAFAAALVFTGLLVLVAWKFFRNNDLHTILVSVLVGLFCTVSPAMLLLIGR